MMATRDFRLYLRLFRYTRLYWKIFLLSIISMVVLAITSPLLATLMKPILDGAFINQGKEAAALVPLLLVSLFILRGFSAYIGDISMGWVAQKIIMKLRQEMFVNLIDFPSRYFDQTTTGKLISRFTFDVIQIKEAATRAILILVRDLLAAIGLILWMIYVDWLLALICLSAAPFIISINLIIKRRLRKMSGKVQDTMGAIHHVLEECFGAQKIIKLYDGRETEIGRFVRVADGHRRFSTKFMIAAAANSPLVQIAAAIVLAIAVYIAIQQAHTGAISVGDFVSFFTAMIMLFTPIKRLVGLNEHIQKGLAACESVFALIDAKAEKDTGKKVLGRASGMVEYSGVSHRYHNADRLALDTVSLKINAGEMIALIGTSGGGKTTLANLLPRLYEPLSGVIKIDGVDIRAFTLQSLRKNIAYVNQDTLLFNETIRNNIAYGALRPVDDEVIWRAAEGASAAEFIRQLPDGMETTIWQSGVRLSGGQKQRLAIARALLKDAPILILDEATSSLDTHSERQIQSALNRIKSGRTCIVIAHRLSTIESADRVAVLERGKIVELGSHAALLEKNGRYTRLYRAQFKNSKDT